MFGPVSSTTLQGRRRKSSFTASSRPAVRRILEAHTNACRWRRALAPELLVELSALTEAHGQPHVAQVVDQEPAAALVAHVGLAAPPKLAEWLARDIEKLRVVFRALDPSARTIARLEVVTTDKCRRFHADYKTLRAVCTYAGPSTEWVENTKVDRVALVDRCEKTPMDVQNERIVPDRSAVQHAAPGDVILLKGDGFREHPAGGAVHRSPPIEAARLKRLVLTLDFL